MTCPHLVTRLVNDTEGYKFLCIRCLTKWKDVPEKVQHLLGFTQRDKLQ